MEGRCVIGAVATVVTSELLTSVMTDCLSRYSHIQIAVDEIPTPRQLPALARGEIDLALAHAYLEPAEVEAFDRHQLVEDRVRVALIGASHPLASHATIQPAELAEVPFLFMERAFHPVLYDKVMAALAAIGLPPRIDGTQDSLHAVWTLAAQGQGWCLGFDSQRRRPPAGTVAVPIAGLDLRWGIDLLSRKGGVESGSEDRGQSAGGGGGEEGRQVRGQAGRSAGRQIAKAGSPRSAHQGAPAASCGAVESRI